jgi:hypothetical protein
MNQDNQLPLTRCPHCNIAKPLLIQNWMSITKNYANSNQRCWSTYQCQSCGGIVLACSPNDKNYNITNMWPSPKNVDEVVPVRAKEFLEQAIASLHAPAGAIMLTASSVDAMLKDKGYKDGNLNARIDEAAKDNLITKEMASWAHEIRLDANDQRHADESAPLPNEADAQKAIEFASALAQFLFVLPARVARGRKP